MSNIILSPAARPAQTGLVGRLLAAVPTLWGRFQKAWRLRATIRTLHRLNDHSLRDIGLEQDDIERVVRERSPGW
jgi:uncharacterized protein YjiS (DUF1127 family)